MTGLLSSADFLNVVKHTPLVSIDLIITDNQGRHLLGKRKNAPAKGYWFVPGGRIRKNECLKDAFRRLTLEEIGVAMEISDARLLGIYEHFYDDNFAGTSGISTHYVVLAYCLIMPTPAPSLPDTQHNDYRWDHGQTILNDASVHGNTRCYFSS
jgi:colanic acid biosynthesis protein WcaH